MSAQEAVFKLRDATPDDTATIAALVGELAAHAMLAEIDGASVGLALYFFNFSTFLGRHGLYIEDVFVRPAHRGCGIGRALFQALAARAVAEGCGRMDWAVLDWNEPALRFYRGLGARPMCDWTIHRLTGDALTGLASAAPPRRPCCIGAMSCVWGSLFLGGRQGIRRSSSFLKKRTKKLLSIRGLCPRRTL